MSDRFICHNTSNRLLKPSVQQHIVKLRAIKFDEKERQPIKLKTFIMCHIFSDDNVSMLKI